MDKSFSEKLTESENVKKVSPKSALYRHTEGLREVYRRMQAAKGAEGSKLIFQKLQQFS